MINHALHDQLLEDGKRGLGELKTLVISPNDE
jgi:hypothetical protein